MEQGSKAANRHAPIAGKDSVGVLRVTVQEAIRRELRSGPEAAQREARSGEAEARAEEMRKRTEWSINRRRANDRKSGSH